MDEDPGLLRWLKSSPGDVSLKTMLDEIAKLETIRSFALPANLLRDVAVKVAGEWVTGALIESPSHLRRHSGPLLVAMLAGLLVDRQQQITDQLVRLLISTVHRIGLRAEKKVMREMVAQFTRVTSKESLLLRVADAAVHRPDGTVRQVVYPVLGEETLRNLAAEYKASRPVITTRMQATYRESYTRHYRQGLVKLLEVLEFRCGNSHQPVLDAVGLVRRYAGGTQFISRTNKRSCKTIDR